MKQLLALFSALILIVVFSKALVAQISLSGEIRPRSEFRHGFKEPLETGKKPAFFTEQRTRLVGGYKSKKVEVGVSIQDVRIWGSVDQVYKVDPSLMNVNQAWATIKMNELNKVIVGRQILDYDNARILGSLDWAQQGRSHDLLRYIFENKSWSVHLGLAFNQDSYTPEPAKLDNTFYASTNNYKTLHYTWIKKLFEKSSISVLLLNQGMQIAPDTVNYNQSIGVNVSHKIGESTFKGEWHYQAGKNGRFKKIKGFLAAISLDHSFNNVGTTIGIDWLSGDNPNTDSFEAFTPWYGTNHKFYGLMDYFYVGNGHKNFGLVNPYFKTHISINERTRWVLHLHHFISDTRIKGSNHSKTNNNILGNELDLVFSYNITPDVNLKLGYSQMFFARGMEVVKETMDPRKTASWGWAMLTLKPKLIKKD